MSNKEFETLETNKEIKNMSIEERRQAFLINYKKDQKIQLIVSVVFVVLVLAGLFLILNYPSYLIFTFLGILICFVGLSTYSKTCSKKKEANIKDFVESYREYERSKVYDDRFNAISNESYKEVAKEEIIDLNLFSSTQVVESNNYIDARYLSKEFKSYSLAIYKDKVNLAFIGKYYAVRLEKEVEGRTIINLGSNPIEINIDGLNQYELGFNVYSSLNEDEINTLIDEEIKQIINSFVFDENTLNVCILIENNYLKVFVNYSNKFVDVPVENAVDENVLDVTKGNLNRILGIYNNI